MEYVRIACVILPNIDIVTGSTYHFQQQRNIDQRLERWVPCAFGKTISCNNPEDRSNFHSA